MISRMQWQSAGFVILLALAVSATADPRSPIKTGSDWFDTARAVRPCPAPRALPPGHLFRASSRARPQLRKALKRRRKCRLWPRATPRSRIRMFRRLPRRRRSSEAAGPETSER